MCGLLSGNQKGERGVHGQRLAVTKMCLYIKDVFSTSLSAHVNISCILE